MLRLLGRACPEDFGQKWQVYLVASGKVEKEMATLGTALMGALGHSDEEKMFRPWSVYLYALKITHWATSNILNVRVEYDAAAECRLDISVYCDAAVGGMLWRTLSSMD